MALLPDDLVVTSVPSAFRLGQAITSYTGPLFRRDGVAASTPATAGMSGAEAVASVRAQGIRALTVDIPAANASTPVRIRIYDLAGRPVRILVDETLDPGSYLVGWDGTDQSGRSVRPGVYLAIMTAGEFRSVRRLILK